jgi:hypothetical protein
VKLELASHPCEEGGHGWGAGLGVWAWQGCIGGGLHGRLIGGPGWVFPGILFRKEFCALAGDTSTYDYVVIDNV